MELSTKAKNEINEVRKYYEDKNLLADIDFLCSIFDIMLHEDGFSDVLSYEIIKYGRCVAYKMWGRVFVDIDKALKETLYLYKKNNKDIESEVACRNMYMLVIVFHELTHISESYGFSIYPELNNLFESFYDVYHSFKYFLYFRLFKRRYDFCERHASTHSYRLLSEIYEEGELNEALGDNYFAMVKENIKRKYVDYAIKHLGLNYGYLKCLPLIQKLDTGITLSSEEECYVKSIIEEYEVGNINFCESINKLKQRRY